MGVSQVKGVPIVENSGVEVGVSKLVYAVVGVVGRRKRPAHWEGQQPADRAGTRARARPRQLTDVEQYSEGAFPVFVYTV